MKNKNQWKKPDRETTAFLIFWLAMACYYGWRLFALTPWYDELYTYYYFISRGPVYAAIHWPLPNNHVGYSTLSACLGILGSPAVALRGVSYLCSLGSLILLFRIGRKVFAPEMALVPVFLLAGFNLVNNLAVQGRGYALVTFCYLAAIWELLSIVAERRDRTGCYVIFGMALVAALWAIPSSVYVAVPICLIGGWTAFIQREYQQLKRLIGTSLLAAVCTAGLYAVLWLAIGSNLLSKAPEGDYYGMAHVAIIMQTPLGALRTGIEYMLATPYIQSVSREVFREQFGEWLQTLFGTHFAYGSGGRWGILYAAVFGVGVILLAARIIRRLRNREYAPAGREPEDGQEKEAVNEAPRGCYDRWIEWYLLLTIVILPLFLILQCTLPYYRVFSFAGVMVALLVTWLVQYLADWADTRKKAPDGEAHGGKRRFGLRHGLSGNIKIAAVFISGLLCFYNCCVNSQSYSMRDEWIRDAYEQVEMEKLGTIAVTDCDQEYLLWYLYGIGEEQVSRQIAEADLVLIDKNLLGRDYDSQEAPEEWKFYLTREEIPVEYLEQEMEEVYENGQFVMYERK